MRARDLKFGMGVENGVSRNKFKYLSTILNICRCLHDFSYFITLYTNRPKVFQQQ